MQEFTVFYSFQTDSHEKTNFHFLRDLLEVICREINHYKVNLDWGFKETTGTRPLTNHMLTQSEKADIFIGDVTYTSEHNKHLYKTHWLLNKYSKIQKHGAIKKYPNGNVLLETGYSWARKNYARTLLVMNTAYGNPEEDKLPVDMMHLEWPIHYHLSENQLRDSNYVDKISTELKGKLKKKILDIIESERNYLRYAFEPISHFEDWPGPNYSMPFQFTDPLQKKVEEYRIQLEKPGGILNCIGAKSSGKTRLARELFQKNKPFFSRHDCIFKTYYYNFQFGSFDKIHKPLLEMKRKNQHFVIILDNCSTQEINNVKAILEGTQISILFIQES